jgi:hypothetical protein
MTVQERTPLKRIAQELHLSEDEILERSLRGFLQDQLRDVKAEIFRIHGRYSVSSVEEMEDRYRDGTLDEADSWQDLQRLDHLEYKREQLTELLESVS